MRSDWSRASTGGTSSSCSGARRPSPQTLAQVKDQIKQTLLQQAQSAAFQKWVNAQQKKDTVVILDAGLKKLIGQTSSAQQPVTTNSGN